MGYPKALLHLEGKTFLERILDAIAAAGIEDVVVVVGHHRRVIEQAFPLPRMVFNPRYEQGMSTSVQAGIQALPANCTAAAVFLVDHPLIDEQTIRKLTPHVRPGSIVVPVHGARRGHPIVIAAELFPEVIALTPDQGLNVVVRRDPARIVEVLVQEPGVLRDIDTPEQFEKLLRENG